MLLKDFNSELRNRMHAFLWRQWGQLGLASASVESKDEWVIDPEALLLLTGTLGRWDPRLFDEVIVWILKNASSAVSAFTGVGICLAILPNLDSPIFGRSLINST